MTVAVRSGVCPVDDVTSVQSAAVAVLVQCQQTFPPDISVDDERKQSAVRRPVHCELGGNADSAESVCDQQFERKQLNQLQRTSGRTDGGFVSVCS